MLLKILFWPIKMFAYAALSVLGLMVLIPLKILGAVFGAMTEGISKKGPKPGYKHSHGSIKVPRNRK